MIFIGASDEPTILLLLTEADVNDMRGGRTKFVDSSATGGMFFNKVVLSGHKNPGEIEEMITRAGHGKLLAGMPSPVADKVQGKCAGCDGITEECMLLDGKCIACWRESARSKT